MSYWSSFSSGSGTSFSGKCLTASSFSVQDFFSFFLSFLSQTWSSLENHNSNYLTDLKNLFLSSLAWRKRKSRICCDCLCLYKPDKPKYFHENESSSFSFGIISFLESQSSDSWSPQPQPGLLDFGKSLLRA